MGFAFFEIMINVRGRWVGGSFTNQSHYQLVAKAHEILIDASLTSIVLSYIQYELTAGNGLPFGAFLGGLQFLSVSYLWSRELWASAFATCYSLRKRVGFVILIVICGTLAATAGPASATLLIPRESLWPVEPAFFMINGTFQDIWPDRLDSQQVPKHCSHINESAPDPLCPAAQVGLQLVEFENILSFWTDEIDPNAEDQSTELWIIPSPESTTWNTAMAPCIFSNSSTQSCGEAISIVVSSAAFDNPALWQGREGFSSFIDSLVSIADGFYQAYTAVNCVSDTIMNVNDTTPLQFPRLS